MTISLSSITAKNQFAATLTNTLASGGTSSSAKHGTTYDAGGSAGLANGTGPGQADRVWQSVGRVLLAAASEVIDLHDFTGLDIGAGAGNDANGQPLALAEIVRILVVSDPSSVGDLIVGAEGSAAAWTSFNGSGTVPLKTIKPGGELDGIDVTDPAMAVADATNHLLKLEASGGDVTYSIYILGRSA